MLKEWQLKQQQKLKTLKRLQQKTLNSRMQFDNRELTEIAQVSKVYGLKGHLSIKFHDSFSAKLFNEEIPVFLLIEGMPVPFFVEDYKNSGGYTATKFKFINSATEAEKFVDAKVLICSDDIEDDDEFEDEYEMVGYKVFDTNHGYIGDIVDFNLIPGNPVFETDFNGKSIIIPYTEDIVVDINDEKEEVYINAPNGLIDIY
ncbi:MAG: 16S rRNA processing protein RimM, partial [Bacteroidales bacterium]|nr:16S rRNA processing protein RimM [Bacteroidales bacterium]